MYFIHKRKKFFYLLSLFTLCAIILTCAKNDAIKINKQNIDASNIAQKKEINVTIFVHGTHTFLTYLLKSSLKFPNELTKISVLKSYWYAPVLKYMAKHNQEEFPEDSFYMFGWPGELCEKCRENAAQTLYLSIKKLMKEYADKNLKPKITMITHSHGGNVALNLAKVKIDTDTDLSIDRLVLLACPVQELTKKFINNKIFKKVYNIYSSADMFQVLDPQGIYKINKHNKDCPIFSKRRFGPIENLKQAKIKVNDRAILHVEFIYKKFLKILPRLLIEMDKIENNFNEHLIKIYSYKNEIKIIDMNNYRKKLKKINTQPETCNKMKSDNITIFVHGTHTLSKLIFTYTNENNKLVKVEDLNKKYCPYVLAKQIYQTNPIEFPFEEFYTFGWSGELSYKAREDAGKILYAELQNLINQYKLNKRNPKITIITHSHGGNVGLNLARIQNKETDFKIDRLILLAAPIQEKTKNLVTEKIFNKVYNIYSSMDTLQILDPQGLYQENKNNKNCPTFSKRRFDVNLDNLKQSKIKINNRALMHIEFITEKFFKILPNIIDEMDKINSDPKHLIKVDTNKNTVETVI